MSNAWELLASEALGSALGLFHLTPSIRLCHHKQSPSLRAPVFKKLQIYWPLLRMFLVFLRILMRTYLARPSPDVTVQTDTDKSHDDSKRTLCSCDKQVRLSQQRTSALDNQSHKAASRSQPRLEMLSVLRVRARVCEGVCSMQKILPNQCSACQPPMDLFCSGRARLKHDFFLKLVGALSLWLQIQSLVDSRATFLSRWCRCVNCDSISAICFFALFYCAGSIED